jgi:hypothetical protein
LSERDALILGATRGEQMNSAGWVRVHCPLCERNGMTPDRRASLGYRPETGGFKCFRCEAHGRVQRAGYVAPPPTPPSERDKVRLDIDFNPLHTDENINAISLAPAREFLIKRGITREHWRAANIGAAVSGYYAGRVIVPHVESFGKWWGFTARCWTQPDEDVPKVLYPANMDRERLYNEHALDISTPRPCLVVEGCLDAAWYLPDVVACLGKPTAAHYEKLRAAQRPLIIALDGDAWEEGDMLAFRLRFDGVNARAFRLPPGEDPNSINPNTLREELERRTP